MDFFSSLKKLSEQAGGTVGKSLQPIVDFFKKTTKPNPTLNDLAELIVSHPSSIKEEKELLGIVFSHFLLKIGDYEYAVETKGKDYSYILALDIFHKYEKIISFRSYSEQNINEKPNVQNDLFYSLLKF